jgi:hypothetical protein
MSVAKLLHRILLALEAEGPTGKDMKIRQKAADADVQFLIRKKPRKGPDERTAR